MAGRRSLKKMPRNQVEQETWIPHKIKTEQRGEYVTSSTPITSRCDDESTARNALLSAPNDAHCLALHHPPRNTPRQ